MFFLTISQGESEHKRSKQFYSRVRKGDHVRGIGRHVYRERTLFQAQKALEKRVLGEKQLKFHEEAGDSGEVYTLNIPLGEEEVLGPTPPEDHHQISKDVRHKVDVLKWLADNKSDPALTVCAPFLIVPINKTQKILLEFSSTFERSSAHTFNRS